MRASLRALAVILGLGVLSVGVAVSQQPQELNLPEGLNHVPTDATAFIHVRVGKFLKTDTGKKLLEQLDRDKEAAKVLRQLEQHSGLTLADIDSVTLVFLDVESAFEGRGFRPPETNIFFPKSPGPKPKKGFDIKPREDEQKQEEGVIEELPAGYIPVQFSQPGAGPMGGQMGGPPHLPNMQPLLIVTANKAIDRKKLLRASMGVENRRWGGPQFETVLFLSDTSILVGAPSQLMRFADRPSQPRARFEKVGAISPLNPALTLAAEGHLIVAGGQLTNRLSRMVLEGREGHYDAARLAAFYPLLTMSAVSASLDLGDKAELRIELHGPTARQASLATQAFKNILAMAEIGLEEAAQLLGGKKDPPPKVGQGIDLFKKALGSASVAQDGKVVRCKIAIDVPPELVHAFLSELVGKVRSGGDRQVSQNNLKQIGLALHNYHDVNKGFPPQGIGSVQKKGGPLLSWRVAILPYIEQENLYRQFDLDQPWDHPTNKKLIEQMPAVFAAPGVATKEKGLTHYQVFAGPGSVFECLPGNNPLVGHRLQNIKDGTSNTLMVVEAADPVIWTKPDDIRYDPKQPLPKLGGLYGDGFNAAFCDGSVRFLSDLMEAQLRALISRDGAEVINIP